MHSPRPSKLGESQTNDDCIYRSQSSTPLKVDPYNIGRPFGKGSDDEADVEHMLGRHSLELGEQDADNEGDVLQDLYTEEDFISDTHSTLVNSALSSKSTSLKSSPIKKDGRRPQSNLNSQLNMSTRSLNKLKGLCYFSYSNYDFVKVKVLLSEKHHYVLSRFIISRVLTAVKVRFQDSIQVALKLKKALVDKGKLILTQEELEDELFSMLRVMYQYDNSVIQLYKQMSVLHHQKIPIVIIVSGTFCIDKAKICAKLSDRLNLSCTLSTEIIYELVSILHSKKPYKYSKFFSAEPLSEEDCISIFKEEYDLIESGMNADVTKYLYEGKSFIIEGEHVTEATWRLINRQLDKPGIIVPILLMQNDPNSHREVVAEHIQYCADSDLVRAIEIAGIDSVTNSLLANFSWLQSFHDKHLASHFNRINIDNINTFKTLDDIHSLVLEKIKLFFDTF